MSIQIITRDQAPTEARQGTMELLADVAQALRRVAHDYLPGHFAVGLNQHPPAIELRVPGQTNAVVEAALHVLAEELKAVTDKNLPALPLKYVVIGGSEAAGIEITPEGEALRYPTYHRLTRHDVGHLRLTPAAAAAARKDQHR